MSYGIVMVVNTPEALITEQAEHINRTSTVQPTEQVTEQVRSLLLTLSNEQLSLKSLMEKIDLKHRPTFIENFKFRKLGIQLTKL
ncbi:MAG: hypothetical protein SOR57_07265 [Parabacteroides sp.]|nr:hypothetical protein [Parabacteroides sp.]